MQAALNSSVRMDWQTPDEVLDLVRKVNSITLDPCTSVDNPVGAYAFFTPQRPTTPHAGLFQGPDGLLGMWADYEGLVYVNPPYGREISKWVTKAIAEATYDAEIVMLVPARTDTKWFQTALGSANGLLLWRGRMTFKGAPAPAPFPSAVFYWGENSLRFRKAFEDKGLFVVPQAWR